MSATQVDTVLRAAVSEGVLPKDAEALEQDSRPWPIVLLTALGAWLAAIPLIGGAYGYAAATGRRFDLRLIK